jgi:LAS superfamily LD-carboxypeptidase LdcB
MLTACTGNRQVIVRVNPPIRETLVNTLDKVQATSSEPQAKTLILTSPVHTTRAVITHAEKPIAAAAAKKTIKQAVLPSKYNVKKLSEYSNRLILINKWTPLPANFAPASLKSVVGRHNALLIPSKYRDTLLEKTAFDAAVAMFSAAEKAGIKDLVISSGYRSYDKQSYYYTNKVNKLLQTMKEKDAIEQAKTVVAYPGTSEHQAGLALDLTVKALLKKADPLEDSFGRTAAGKWVGEHAWKFGYVVRYQPEKTTITGVISEPWHIRYVGLPHAEIMIKNNMCLEEYLEHVKHQTHMAYTDTAGTKYEIFYRDASQQPTSDATVTDITTLPDGSSIVTSISK